MNQEGPRRQFLHRESWMWVGVHGIQDIKDSQLSVQEAAVFRMGVFIIEETKAPEPGEGYC